MPWSCSLTQRESGNVQTCRFGAWAKLDGAFRSVAIPNRTCSERRMRVPAFSTQALHKHLICFITLLPTY